MTTTPPENTDISKISEVPVLLKLWEEKYQESPLPILKRLAEIVEGENEEFLKLDPDPYDDRHPSRTHPSCPLGATLKCIFKKENLISKLMRDYLRDDLDVCIAAARVFIAILPGLETSIVYQETEGLINRLFTWAEKGPEPLQSYALGLLGASMEVPEVAGKFKDRNLKLVPQMLKRLKSLQDEFLSLHRPFAQFSNKADVLEDFADCSSSSWAEMEMNIIGTFQVYPVNLASRQIFTLRYLAPLGEYQEMLSSAFESNALGIILKYLQRGKDTRLIFEALKYLSALLCHKKFAIEFIDCGGLQKLLTTPRPSISATGVSMCLYYIAYSEDAMEKVCLLSKDVLQSLVNYAMWLLECSHNSGRNHAIMFFSVVYHFKLMIDLFDSNDGLRRILNVISTAPNILGGEDISEEEQSSCRQSFRQVSYNLRRYFESHLAFFGERLKSTVDKDGTYHVTPYKPLRTSLEKQRLLHEQILDRIPPHYRWQPVERFLKLNGMQALMQVIAMAYDWNYAGRNETVKNVLDVISICCLCTKPQLLLTERYQLQGSTAPGTAIILNAGEGEVVSDVEVQKSALQILINCVSGKKSDTLTRMWESIRLNNGILILTRLLNTKMPITEADYIRALACKCLSGLARYKVICQILEQLPLIGQLKVLMREPILQEKRQDHVMFQKYALEILKNFYGEEYEIDLVRKNDLVSTVVDYNEGQLFELMLGHLRERGFTDTCKVFETEMSKMRNRKKDEKPDSSRVETPKKKIELKRTISRRFEKPTMYNSKMVTLDGIVKEYLLNQHALCKTPMATCPPFDLLIRHKCPSENIRKVNYKSPSVNVVERMTRFQTFGGGVKFTDRDRRIAFSKFKPFRVIRSETEDNFTTASFSSCYQWMIAGNTQGEIKLYNINNSTVEGTYPCHESEIYHIQPNSKGNLLLTSSTWRRPLSALWKMESLFDKIVEFDKDEYAEFSKLAQDKVISTNMDHCRVTDIETQKEILNLEPTTSNQYLKNRATFDPHDDLILSDGVLFDFKSGKEIHKFDKLNENFNGVFNPTGLEIISNSEIWDIRTFHLLKTVRLFDQMQLTFTNCGNVVYGVKCDSLDTSFVSFDSMYYESIGTVQVKRQILNLCTSPNDLQIALVENATNEDVNDSCIRFYEVGRSREDEDEPTEEDDDEDLQSEASDSNEEEEDNDIDRLLEELLPEGDIVDDLFGGAGNSDDNSDNSDSGSSGSAESDDSSQSDSE